MTSGRAFAFRTDGGISGGETERRSAGIDHPNYKAELTLTPQVRSRSSPTSPDLRATGCGAASAAQKAE